MSATRSYSSNELGAHNLPALMPGPYNLTIEANGFKTIHLDGVAIEICERAHLDFTLTIGSKSDSITVLGSAPLFYASDASVSTLMGSRFVDKMSLSRCTFSSLIDLAPGVVLAPSNFCEQGYFNVNGPRPDANYFPVDGVSSDLGTGAGGGWRQEDTTLAVPSL